MVLKEDIKLQHEVRYKDANFEVLQREQVSWKGHVLFPVVQSYWGLTYRSLVQIHSSAIFIDWL